MPCQFAMSATSSTWKVSCLHIAWKYRQCLKPAVNWILMAPYNMLSHALFCQLSSQRCHKAVILMTLNYTRHRSLQRFIQTTSEAHSSRFPCAICGLSFNLANNFVFIVAWLKPMHFREPLVGVCFDCINLE